MRIDKVHHREYSIRKFQLMVNEMVKKGFPKEKIELNLDKLKILLTEGNSGEEINLITPKIALETSHLKKGYVAFFKCPNCLKKVRTLYYVKGLLACRISHGLTYKKQDKRQITVNRLIKDDELRERYHNSWRTSRGRRALEADWAIDAIMESGNRKGKEILDRFKNSASK